MSRPLKMFMRGKRITMLQEILQRMGYPMHDQTGLFGASTRDAIKDVQKQHGLKPSGSVDDDLLKLLQQGPLSTVTTNSDTNPTHSKDSSPIVCNQQQLDALTNLLIKKGIITKAELDQHIAQPKPLRVTQPPLV